MKQNKKSTILTVLVVFLVAVCVVEGIIIYKQDSPKQSVKTFESFSSNMLDKLKREQKEQDDMFDRFFDDDFFSRQPDPFVEMQRLQKQLDEMMGRNHRGIFRDSWNSWFGERFLGGSDGVVFDQKEKNDSYIITLRIPNLEENKLDIKIEKDGISISGEFSQTAEKKDPDGNVISKREVNRTISKNFPIPDDADYEKAHVDNKKDKIIIVLPKHNTELQ